MAAPTIDRNTKITFGMMGTALAAAVAAALKLGALSSDIGAMAASMDRVEHAVEKIDERQQLTTLELVDIRAEQKALRSEMEALKARLR